MNKKTISDFKIKKSVSGKLSVFYKDKQFFVISEKVLFKIILETSPAWFLNSLSSLVNKSGNKESLKIDNAVLKFATVYAFEKLVFYKKNVKSINDVSVSDSAKKLLDDRLVVGYFKEAIKTMNNTDVKNVSTFIKAQIEGLKFVNNGQGTFPKPNQLATDGALTRLLEYTSSTKKDEKEIKPDRYWFFDEKTDGDLTLSENLKYQEAIKKIKEKTAALNVALYAKKCYSKRRSGSYSLIEEYIKDISV